MNIYARVTEQGLSRLPSSFLTGDLLKVHKLTPGAGGDYWVAHVFDSESNIWSLGEGDWTPAGLDKEHHVECDHCAVIIDNRIRKNACCHDCATKRVSSR